MKKGRDMPRFYFEARGSELIPDPQGVVLDDLKAARQEAVRLEKALRRDYPEVFAEPRSWRMCILDDAGQTLDVLPFESLPPRPGANDA